MLTSLRPVTPKSREAQLSDASARNTTNANAEDLLRWGWNGINEGDFDVARNYFTRLIRCEPTGRYFVEALVGLGLADFNQQNYSGAREKFERALAENPQHIPALQNMTATLIELKELRRALGFAKQHHKVDMTSTDVYFNLGVIYRELGDTKNAILAFKSARDKNRADLAAAAEYEKLVALK